MKINIDINCAKTVIEANRYEDVINMHIKKLLDMLGNNLRSDGYQLTLRNYVEVTVYNVNDRVWGRTIWVPPTTQHMITSDGHTRSFKFDHFVQIVEVVPGIPGMELVPISPLSPINTDLLYDINKPSELGFEIIASPIIDNEQFDWKFNAGNGLIAFYNQCNNHKVTDKDGYTRVVLYHDRYMGYHFDRATDSTILKYYKPITTKAGNVS